ncbi:hypothetical protein A2U01_0118169, partial [Trifolium medium]|nr:hypothetical protein [Trifolium medium]
AIGSNGARRLEVEIF